MYIPPFWCGVAVTIIVETIIALVAPIFHKDNDDEE